MKKSILGIFLGIFIAIFFLMTMYFVNTRNTENIEQTQSDTIKIYDSGQQLYLYSHLIALGNGEKDYQSIYFTIREKDTLVIDTLNKYIYKDTTYLNMRIHIQGGKDGKME